MKHYEASITIPLPPEKVWAVLLDTGAWPEWDPYCERIEGRIALGATVRAVTKLSPGRAFPVKVTELVPGQRMVWSGGMPLGLFKGERTFLLERQGDDTRFTLREEFSGPMLKLIGRTIPDMTEPFARFAEGLRNRATGARQEAR